MSPDDTSGLTLGITMLSMFGLLACANVGGLRVARNLGRRMEVAIRASLGAGRGRLTRQLLTEVLTLASLAGGIGLLLARLGMDLLFQFLPGELLAGQELRVDGLVVSVILTATLPTSVLTGVFPGSSRASSTEWAPPAPCS